MNLVEKNILLAQRCYQWLKNSADTSCAVAFYCSDHYGARIFVDQLIGYEFCQSAQEESVCGTCYPCNLFAQSNHPDFHVVGLNEGQTKIGIEQIRDLSNRLTRKSQIHQRHVILIERLDRLTIAAANALLKTLEESPSRALFICLAKSDKDILSTIRSRCFQLFLTIPTAKQVVEEAKFQANSVLSLQSICKFLWRLKFGADFLMFSDQIEQELSQLLQSWSRGCWQKVPQSELNLTDQVDFLLLVLRFVLSKAIQTDPNTSHTPYDELWLLYRQLLDVKRQLNTGIVLNDAMLLGTLSQMVRPLRFELEILHC